MLALLTVAPELHQTTTFLLVCTCQDFFQELEILQKKARMDIEILNFLVVVEFVKKKSKGMNFYFGGLDFEILRGARFGFAEFARETVVWIDAFLLISHKQRAFLLVEFTKGVERPDKDVGTLSLKTIKGCWMGSFDTYKIWKHKTKNCSIVKDALKNYCHVLKKHGGISCFFVVPLLG